MKAIIMAAGKGKRMGDITKEIPKPLIKIKERPFLYFLIKNIHKAGIEDIGIVVGHKKEKIAEFIKEHEIKAELIEQEKPLGTGDAVRVTENFIDEDDFMVLNGDNLYSADDIKSMKIHDKYCYIGALFHEHPERYGAVKNKGEFLVEIVEKPTTFISNYVSVGIYKFTKDIFKALKEIKLSPRGEYEVTDAINILAKEKKVKIIELKKKWLDLTSLEDIEKVKEELHHVVDEDTI